MFVSEKKNTQKGSLDLLSNSNELIEIFINDKDVIIEINDFGLKSLNYDKNKVIGVSLFEIIDKENFSLNTDLNESESIKIRGDYYQLKVVENKKIKIITLQKKEDIENYLAERNLAKIVDAIPLVLVEFEVLEDKKIEVNYMSSGIFLLLPDVKMDDIYACSDTILERVHKDDIGLLHEAVTRSIIDNVDLFVEFRFDIGQKEVYWVELTGEPEIRKDHRVKFRGLLKHISARKKAEQSLNSTIETYTDIFDSVNYGIVLLTDDMKINQINPAAMKILGVNNPSDVYDKNIMELILGNCDSEVWRKQFNKIFSLKKKTQVDISTKIVDIEYYSLNWELRDTQIRGYITIDDKSTEVLAQSELQKSNFLYNYFSRTANEVIWDLDLSSGALNWGEGMLNLLGCPEYEITTFDEFLKFIHPNDFPAISDCYFRATNAKGNRIWDIEYRFKKSGKAYIYLKNDFAVIKDVNNKPIRFVGVLRDISGSVFLKKERALSVYDALKKEREHVSMEIHDNIGQHLIALNIYLNQLKVGSDKALFDKTSKILQDTIKETRSLAYRMKPPELEEGFLSAIQLLVFNLEQMNKLKVQLFIDSNLKDNDFAFVDEFQNYRIVQEFINNSVKHSNAKNIELNMERSGQFVFIEIKDDGRGFDLNEFDSYGLGIKNMMHRSQIANSFLCYNSKLNEGCYLKIKIREITGFC